MERITAMEMNVWDDLKKIVLSLTESGELNESIITLETKLIEDLEFDSVQLMMLLNEIERKFGVDFTDLEDFQDKFNLCRLLVEGIEELIGNNR